MTKLPVFDPKAPCPKCGGVSFKVGYRDGKNDKCWDDCPEQEHLDWGCDVCMYMTSFAPMDAGPRSSNIENPEARLSFLLFHLTDLFYNLTEKQLRDAGDVFCTAYNKRMKEFPDWRLRSGAALNL